MLLLDVKFGSSLTVDPFTLMLVPVWLLPPEILVIVALSTISTMSFPVPLTDKVLTVLPLIVMLFVPLLRSTGGFLDESALFVITV